MAAPTVQTLDQVMAELAPGYEAQNQIIQKQQAGLGAKFGAQKQGLEATKVQGFNTINNQATGRGMSFSGIPLDEQATYLSTKYLPAVAAVDQQQNDEDLALQTQAAKLGTEQRNTALGRIDSQTSSLNAWNLQQAQLEAQAREGALTRQAAAQQAAAARGASSSAANSSMAARQKLIAQADQTLSAVGGDRKVHPDTWNKALTAFIAGGGDLELFKSIYGNKVNVSHVKDYLGW